MAENGDENTATDTDIFQQQKKTIDTLIDVLDRTGTGGQPQTVYVQPAEPVKPAPNYVMIGAIAILAIMLFTKK